MNTFLKILSKKNWNKIEKRSKKGTIYKISGQKKSELSVPVPAPLETLLAHSAYSSKINIVDLILCSNLPQASLIWVIWFLISWDFCQNRYIFIKMDQKQRISQTLFISDVSWKSVNLAKCRGSVHFKDTRNHKTKGIPLDFFIKIDQFSLKCTRNRESHKRCSYLTFREDGLRYLFIRMLLNSKIH